MGKTTSYYALTFNEIKEQVILLNKGDKLYCGWGVEDLYTYKTYVVNEMLIIKKVSNKKYIILPLYDIFYDNGKKLIFDACKKVGVHKWLNYISCFSIRLDYEDLLKVLNTIKDILNTTEKLDYTHKVSFFSFDRKESRNESDALSSRYEIEKLEDRIENIEEGIKKIANLKKELNELKQKRMEYLLKTNKN